MQSGCLLLVARQSSGIRRQGKEDRILIGGLGLGWDKLQKSRWMSRWTWDREGQGRELKEEAADAERLRADQLQDSSWKSRGT